MYLQRARLRDVKCFADVELRFQSAAETGDRQSNWNVILGENGDGKTTLLQGIAACLMDATTADRTLQPSGWVRGKATAAMLEATLIPESGDFWGRIEQGSGAPPREVQYAILAAGKKPGRAGHAVSRETLVGPSYEYDTLFGERFGKLSADFGFLLEGPFLSAPGAGWFSAGYGPLRRPSSPKSTEFVPSEDAVERRFSTLFQERAALFDVEGWLKELDWLARRPDDGALPPVSFEEAVTAIKSLLPEISDIALKGTAVVFVKNGVDVTLDQLSHGYRTMFALAVDILRGIAHAGARGPLLEARGVVLIDEVDAHLHPEWQRHVGFMLCKAFENIQFIVTSHSPFVAMAAGEGGLTLLEREEKVVRARQHLPNVRGWAVDRVLSQLFGQSSLRDPETEEMLVKYEKLRSERTGHALSAEKKTELGALEHDLDQRLRGERDSLQSRRLDESLDYFARVLQEREGKTGA